MTLEPCPRAFALPRALRPTLTQADVASYFAEANCNFDDDELPPRYFAYCTRTKSWRVATDTYCTQWRSPAWSCPEECDVTPIVYSHVIKLIRQLTDQSPPAEQHRALSHSFISGVVKLLQVDPRIAHEPWECEMLQPPRPMREILRAEHDARQSARYETRSKP